MARFIRRLLVVLIVLAVPASIVWAAWPRPIEVTTARVERGPLRVTVDEDGNTRIKERYVISAPLAGRQARIALKEGDPVTAGETIIATIDPQDPTLLDPRARAQAEARVKAAEASLAQAETMFARSSAALELAQTEAARIQEAAAAESARPIEIERVTSLLAMRTEERRAAGFARDTAQFELELARAALLRSKPDEAPADMDWRLAIKSPVSGRVLRLLHESAAVVAAGEPLIEVGDPHDLELVVDVLSSDGVAITPGAPAILEQWGGEAPLHGRVRLVEPSAFLKISALGVEEQRVNVIIDLVEPPEARPTLGDGFRIEARIITWEEPGVLKVPTGALFRHAKSWAVFRVVDGRARVTPVEIGRRGTEEAQIRAGLSEGDTVVIFPSDRVRNGVRVAER